MLLLKLACVATALSIALPATAQTGRLQNDIDAEASKKKKQICKTEIDTGSLVKRTRRCGTEETWRRRNDGENRVARDFVAASSGLIISN